MRDYTILFAVIITSVLYLLSVIVHQKVILPILVAGTIALIVATILNFKK